MRVICAPDSFKESLSAREAAAAMQRGVQQADPYAQVDLCPIADGGEGTVDALVAATNGQIRHSDVLGPLEQPVRAKWGVLGDGRTAVIEMAEASGLHLVPKPQRDPTRTTTFGTGQLIAAALGAGVKRIILGIGGSATCDGGCGAAQALGVRFFGKDGRLITEPMAGGMLNQLMRIDLDELDPRLADVQLDVACDVINPLTGENGAAAVYGPQKGADEHMVRELDQGLAHLATLLARQHAVKIDERPGAGAAGGLGGGAVAFLGGELRRGIDLVLDAVRFDQRVVDCDLCLTGEGKLDGQSIQGKAVLGVAQAAARHDVPTIALVGATGEDVRRTLEHGLSRYIVLGPNLSPDESIRRCGELLEQRAAEVIRAQAGA